MPKILIVDRCEECCHCDAECDRFCDEVVPYCDDAERDIDVDIYDRVPTWCPLDDEKALCKCEKGAE